ncbi:MAG: metal-dependent transcriptional regulator [Ruminococcus sp.]|nr:metal-dependent transcriptional regulator [Ruminococcus sp.]
MSELTYSRKKYLFAIYKLSQNGGEVRSSEVAEAVGVSKASTAAMTVKLCESGYIKKEHYGRISLTESGIKEASSIFASCAVIREFLEKTLGLDEKTADDDAAGIVVHASEKAVNRISEYLLENKRRSAGQGDII